MKIWRVDFNRRRESLSKARIQRRIFQRDALSSLLFAMTHSAAYSESEKPVIN